MANIRDVAQLAGVSISSVSNVLNNRIHQMSNDTRIRIEQAIRELNYHPVRANRTSEKTKSERERIIGLLVPSIVNPSFAALANEVELSAKQYRYRVLLSSTHRQDDEERAFIADMFSHDVRGIIVAASDVRKTHFVAAAERGMMIVSYDNRLSERINAEAALFDSVSMDNVEAGRLAAQHLVDRGCQHIVFVTESSLTLSRSHKIDGFLTVLRNHRLLGRQPIIEGQASSEYGDSEMIELGLALATTVLAMTPRPDGIVAINDALGMGLLLGLRTAGVDVPKDVSVVGIDNISMGALARPSLTSVMPPLAEMAQLMVERLIKRMDDATLKPEEYLFPPSLVCRQSVRAEHIEQE
ncbi:LacI family DNA-binding transcriptional regulator [Serratia sp. NPDC078593]|uniref:LacI family DNA-binding transcriptional regulator n=1 Tax=unclassified Serratia (in: enterobacteria) TaxID=2647522 RepID=UPI0037CCFCCC